MASMTDVELEMYVAEKTERHWRKSPGAAGYTLVLRGAAGQELKMLVSKKQFEAAVPLSRVRVHVEFVPTMQVIPGDEA